VNTVEFALEVIFLSASGVLSPGPLFFANLIYGSKQGLRGGIKMAIGHTVVELPIIIILSLGLIHFSATNFEHKTSLKIIGLLGGIAIICFCVLQIRTIITMKKNGIINPSNGFENVTKYSFHGRPILCGIVFSLLNPFFLAWWFTVGLKLISDSISLFGILLGSAAIFLFHIWMDYAWLGGTSFLARKGISILDVRYYNIILLSLSIVLVIFGLYWVLINAF
jgi:threonine/homoserine/homoserine lactone efflux protein